MRGIEAGSTAWAQGEAPRIRGPWETAIIELAEAGDERFRKILAEHIRTWVIRSVRAQKVFLNDEVTA